LKGGAKKSESAGAVKVGGKQKKSPCGMAYGLTIVTLLTTRGVKEKGQG